MPRVTHRRYWTDAYLATWQATVTAVGDLDGRPALTLDETAFYPASGGQPADCGRLDGWTVDDVREQAGEIWHRLAGGPPPAIGTRVTATLDWARRFDHMQQHTGQHILSQAFLQAVGAQTTAVHMDRTCTIDLAVPRLDADGVARAERLANAVALAARPVRVREIEPDEAAAIGLRRPPGQPGRLRIVEIEGFDRSACGGTHVRTTSEVSPILVTGWQRHKGGVRVEFACGWRALARSQRAFAILRDLSARLTTGPEDLAAAVGRLQEEVKALERDLDATRNALAAAEAERLVAAARAGAPVGPVLVAQALGDRSPDHARRLARALAAHASVVAVVGIEPDRRVVLARSDGVDLDADAVLRAALETFGGRGGGRPAFAEGAAPQAASAAALVAAVAARVEAARAGAGRADAAAHGGAAVPGGGASRRSTDPRRRT